MNATATSAKRKSTAAPAAQSEVRIPPLAASFDSERKVAELQDRADKLQTTLTDVDSMANGAFDRIIAIAKLTLHYMRDPANQRNVVVLANALEQIWYAAEEAQLYQDSEVRDAGLEPNNDTRHLALLRASAAAARAA